MSTEDRVSTYAQEICSYPGCGRPVAYLIHPDGLGAGWRHVDPEDETDSHVGHPMPRGEE